MNKLLKDAIADAKAVRETALANAKLALEEAFSSKVQSMLSHKIKEEMDAEYADDETDKEADATEVTRMQGLAGIDEKSDSTEEPTEEPSEEDYSDEGEEDYSDESGEDYSDEDGEETKNDYSDEDEDDLEEILRQLEEEEGMEGEEIEDGEEMNEEEDIEVEQPSADHRKWGQKNLAGVQDDVDDEMDDEMDEEINLDELINSLREADGEDEEETEEPEAKEDMEEAKKMKKKMMATEAELNEAYRAVKYLRTKLSEINLLNAKLLYVNKLFRRSGLTEAQKVKIVETFDRAKNVRETKLIYATLAETATAPTKKPTATKSKVMEGFASSASKKTNIITEGNQQVNRFKELAGLK